MLFRIELENFYWSMYDSREKTMENSYYPKSSISAFLGNRVTAKLSYLC